MKQKDNIQLLFERLEGSFDTLDAPDNHQKRFLAKLEANDTASSSAKKSINWWKPLSIAATIALLLSAGFFFQKNSTPEVEGLASVSPEMEQTQSYFVTAINQELEHLKSFETEDTKILIEDTLARLQVLENEYDTLKIDLLESGNDKRVIAAMISNFQNRIELLEQVVETIEDIKTLKAQKNEII